MPRTILGIDAAWTRGNESGYALVVERRGRWRCQAVWTQGHGARLSLSGHTPTVVAVDMPISRLEITGRRTADTAVSVLFGSRHCSTHSPSRERPGAVSSEFVAEWVRRGYAVATSERLASRALIEVYPHTALLPLMRCAKRYKYKVSRARTLWPHASTTDRLQRAVAAQSAILARLIKHIDGIDVDVPKRPLTIEAVKARENKVDALVCAWTGIEYLDHRAIALGNQDAAIWIPRAALVPEQQVLLPHLAQAPSLRIGRTK